jgi:BirA family transcriptional regulator, biotin operon repressor / biotin---[acetyl-CoA-carboxylase] ligase
LRPPLSPSDAPALTLMAGLAAHSALAASTELQTDIRWPNDLLINGKKVCGILTEMNAELDRLHSVVLGIGINVNNSEMPADLKSLATSLRIEGKRAYSRVAILVALLKELEKYYQGLLREGTAAIVRAWSAASSFAQGKRVRVVAHPGHFEATTQGLEPNGALLLRRDDGQVITLVSGEVSEIK